MMRVVVRRGQLSRDRAVGGLKASETGVTATVTFELNDEAALNIVVASSPDNLRTLAQAKGCPGSRGGVYAPLDCLLCLSVNTQWIL